MSCPLPRQSAPALAFDTLDGPWSLAERAPGTFTFIIVYRGLHCPLCRNQLQEAHALLSDFEAMGVEVVAVSADTQERAQAARTEWGLPKLSIGYQLAFRYAQPWGLFVSNARKDGEPDRFFEPGLFLVRKDGELYFASQQNMPFGRPTLAGMPKWLQRCMENDVPARGEVDVTRLD